MSMSCYFSYSWGDDINEKLMNEIKSQIEKMSNYKINVIYDKRNFRTGDDILEKERQIEKSDSIVLFFTHSYKTSIGNIRNMESLDLCHLKKQIKRENIDFNSRPSKEQDIAELQEQIKQLRMEVDVLREALNLIKKDPGINIKKLKNHEKAVVIDALKNKYPLPQLLNLLHIAKSSYYYQENAIKRCDKYHELRIQIKEIFNENRNCYVYRRIYGQLKNMGITVSEKIVSRIMKSEKLIVPVKHMRKYSSYKGEISPEDENIINRNFHA